MEMMIEEMIPTRIEAERLLREAEKDNPGPWGNHSRITAHCAEKIAGLCDGLYAEKAYVLGLLHDIGRKFGVRHLGHVSDGYTYMKALGYDEVAKVCLTHSFHNQSTKDYIGKFDITESAQEEIRILLAEMEFNDYDYLIQLCDAVAKADGIVSLEERMNDVKSRYGYYPQKKWDRNVWLKKYFEEKMQESRIY